MADELPKSTEAGKHNDAGDVDGQIRKRVCFICGSQTTLIINIHEPRNGPNIVDVISEKFKTRPLSDDKFLCYSCNNWLINWHSLQSRVGSEKSANEAVPSSASSSSKGGHGSRSPRHQHHRRMAHPCNEVNNDCLTYDDEHSELTITTTPTTPSSAAVAVGVLTASGRASCTTNTVMLKSAAPPPMESETAMEIACGAAGDGDAVVPAHANDGQRLGDGEEPGDSNDRDDHDNDDDPYLTSAIHAARSKLQKYLYYPHKIRRRRKWLASGKSTACESDVANDLAHLTACYRLADDRAHKLGDLISNRMPLALMRRQRQQRRQQRRQRRQQQQWQRRRGLHSSASCTFCRRIIRTIKTRKPAHKLLSAVQCCQRCRIALYTMIERRTRNQHTQSAQCTAARGHRGMRVPIAKHISSQWDANRFARGSSSSSSSPIFVDEQPAPNRRRPAATDAVAVPNSCLVNKLRMLGTTLSYESDQCHQPQAPSWLSAIGSVPETRTNHHGYSTPAKSFHVNNCVVGDRNAVARSDEGEGDATASDSMPIDFEQHGHAPHSRNEIVLTFNTVVTEVFPIELLRNGDNNADDPSVSRNGLNSVYHQQLLEQMNATDLADMRDDDCADSADEEVAAFNTAAAARSAEHKRINEIMKYIPKSLTITLA